MNPIYILNPALKNFYSDDPHESKDIKWKLLKEKPYSVQCLVYKDGKWQLSNGDNNNVFTDGIRSKYVQKYIKVPCRKCPSCVKNDVRKMVGRLSIEAKNHSDTAWFVTLTYEDSNLPIRECVDKSTGEIFYVQSVEKDDIKNFVKRLRSRLEYHGNDISDLKFMYISEYGMKRTDHKRPHYHIILFYDKLPANEFYDYCAQCWQLGHIEFTPLTEGRMRYVAFSHCTASRLFPNPEGSEKPFSSWSRGLGIPRGYTKKFIEQKKSVPVGDFLYPLSDYVRAKLFDEKLTNPHSVRDDTDQFKKYAKRLFPNTKLEDLTFKDVKFVHRQIMQDCQAEFDNFYNKYVIKKSQ